MVIADEWPGNAPELSVAVYGVPRVLPSPSHVIFPKSCEVEKTAVAPVFVGDPLPTWVHVGSGRVRTDVKVNSVSSLPFSLPHCTSSCCCVYHSCFAMVCSCAFSHSVWCPAPRGIMFQLREKSASGISCSNHSGNPVFSFLFTPL